MTGVRLTGLRAIVLDVAGQDMRRCQQCAFCQALLDADQDISMLTLVQRVVMNDEEVLTCRTLWSEAVLQRARHLCANGLDLQAAVLALRQEAKKRGLPGE